MAIEKCETIQELRREFRTITSVVAKDTRFAAQALMFMAERIDALKPKRRATPSGPWARFVKDGMKRGLSMKQIAADWKAKKLIAKAA